LWNAENGELRATLQGHGGVVTSIAFSPDSRRLASCSLDHTVKIWDLEYGRQLNCIAGQLGEDKISGTPQIEAPANQQLPPTGSSEKVTPQPSNATLPVPLVPLPTSKTPALAREKSPPPALAKSSVPSLPPEAPPKSANRAQAVFVTESVSKPIP